MIENHNNPNNRISISETFRKLFLKRGVFEILNEIKFIPKNYNALKFALCGGKDRSFNPIISARTLDSRIRDLKKFGVIELSNSKLENSLHFYRLSNSGIGIFSLINSIINQNTEFSVFKVCEVANKTEQKIRKFNWAFREDEIIQILESNEYLNTLSSKPKKNYIRGFNEAGIKILTEKGTSEVPWAKIKFAWNNLINDEVLARNDYEKATYRSSFILALFSRMQGVKVIRNNPIVIGIQI